MYSQPWHGFNLLFASRKYVAYFLSYLALSYLVCIELCNSGSDHHIWWERHSLCCIFCLLFIVNDFLCLGRYLVSCPCCSWLDGNGYQNMYTWVYHVTNDRVTRIYTLNPLFCFIIMLHMLTCCSQVLEVLLCHA